MWLMFNKWLEWVFYLSLSCLLFYVIHKSTPSWQFHYYIFLLLFINYLILFFFFNWMLFLYNHLLFLILHRAIWIFGFTRWIRVRLIRFLLNFLKLIQLDLILQHRLIPILNYLTIITFKPKSLVNFLKHSNTLNNIFNLHLLFLC